MNVKEEIFRKQAEELVDKLFDNNFFHDNIKRSDMRTIEDIICYFMDSEYTTHVRCQEFINKVKES